MNVDALAEALSRFGLSDQTPPEDGQLARLKQLSHSFLDGLQRVTLFDWFLAVVGEYYNSKVMSKPEIYRRITDKLASKGHEELVDQFTIFMPADWEIRNERTDAGERVVWVKAPGNAWIEFGVVKKT